MDERTTERGRAASPRTLWSLRPAGEHAALRRAAQDAGLRLRALPLQRLAGRPGAAAALAAALAAPIRVCTSPAAVRFARRLVPAWPAGGLDLAVGTGTAEALRTAGAGEVLAPARMDSEGLLALPSLAVIDGVAVGLVTAPGGRGLLPDALRARGAVVRTAEVYERRGLRGAARRVAEFAADPGAVLLASSAEAFALLLARLPAASTARGEALRRRPVVVSSARLAAIAHDAGFRRVLQARGPTPGALVEAASTAAPYTSPAASGRAPL